MARAREELHKEALKAKEAKDNAIAANCPPLGDIAGLSEGTLSVSSRMHLMTLLHTACCGSAD